MIIDFFEIKGGFTLFQKCWCGPECPSGSGHFSAGVPQEGGAQGALQKFFGLWLRGSNKKGFGFVDVKLLGFEVCGSNWYLLGGMSGGKFTMPRGLQSLWWSTEPKRGKIVVVARVEEVSCSNTSAPSVSEPFPKSPVAELMRVG